MFYSKVHHLCNVYICIKHAYVTCVDCVYMLFVLNMCGQDSNTGNIESSDYRSEGVQCFHTFSSLIFFFPPAC